MGDMEKLFERGYKCKGCDFFTTGERESPYHISLLPGYRCLVCEFITTISTEKIKEHISSSHQELLPKENLNAPSDVLGTITLRPFPLPNGCQDCSNGCQNCKPRPVVFDIIKLPYSSNSG